MSPTLVILHVIAGGAILLTGRKLFWFFIMVAGFFLGVEGAGNLLVDYPRWVVWGAAVVAGLAGALLAVVLQRLAFVIGGFMAGGYVAVSLVHSLGWSISESVPLLVGGFLGAFFAAIAMDWAIIILSALAGSVIIISALGLHSALGVLAGGALTIGGIVIQAAYLPGTNTSPSKKPTNDSES